MTEKQVLHVIMLCHSCLGKLNVGSFFDKLTVKVDFNPKISSICTYNVSDARVSGKVSVQLDVNYRRRRDK